ncbi:hypothetical protein AB0M95_18545 [Sphaerisporangium sp. NPDC051017]|uniref:hypothetical protein n=1 Tax=Sphaerisporangium sp. NPDC051017 TaxID=3154636 RepID=UPI003438D8AD
MPHEFKFVLDGAELDEKQQAFIAQAVAEAGSKALGEVLAADAGRDLVAIDVSRLRRWEWVGRAVLLGDIASKVAERYPEIRR